MSDLPFAITPEAAGQIERVLLDAQKDLNLLAMARVLGYTTHCSWTDPEGGGGWYPFPHVVLGWHPSEEVVGNSEYTELELVGFRVFAHQDTLERLRGKRIVLDKGQDMAGVDMLAVEGTVASRRGLR
ncbi:MAG TPA: hypothetical protein VKE74_29315 [Gemmataceae bacterium]|nr:hypothetical protein [Gemmataceae bacterium]